jgi:hypothetical protein
VKSANIFFITLVKNGAGTSSKEIIVIKNWNSYSAGHEIQPVEGGIDEVVTYSSCPFEPYPYSVRPVASCVPSQQVV